MAWRTARAATPYRSQPYTRFCASAFIAAILISTAPRTKGNYETIVSRELWEQVQLILSGRGTKKTRKVSEGLAFSGLINCGHCGCAMVGEIKKGRYVYYHCTGYKGKCHEPYVREEVLEGRFA